ncbi:MAG: hypothetical protein EHM45_03005 [Desulfobacteraceae bacterium]|nr:MAG: hypothetical protein EHM45_03005 [Desulfobacteraceae bacterium]
MKNKNFFTALIILISAIIPIAALAQTITVTTPRGGERWKKGTQQTITWQAPGLSGPVMLFALPAEANTQYKIAEGIPANLGAYSWTAGNMAGGSLQPNRQYRIRVLKDAQHFGDSPGAITLLPPASNQGSVSQPGGGQIQPNQPNVSVTKPTQPNVDISRAPKIEIVSFEYKLKHFNARVKNTGNAPFTGRIHWQWSTDCGITEGNKDISPNQSAQLESASGVLFQFRCEPGFLQCMVHGAFSIEPTDQNGTRYAAQHVEKNFFRYEHSQFFLSDKRVMLRFLNGSKWVNDSQEFIITKNNAFDYNHATKIASFFIGFPVKNCGQLAGNKDQNQPKKLHWSVFHSPSNQYAINSTPIADNQNAYASQPIEPGQGVLVERPISLKVQSGIYMMHITGGTSSGQQHCVISIRFANDLIH